MKVEPTDKVFNTRLYVGTKFEQENLLYAGLYPYLSNGDVAKKFEGRIKATFDDPKFTLTLSNSNFKDAVTFSLVINTEDVRFFPRQLSIKSVQIVQVKGEEFLLKVL